MLTDRLTNRIVVTVAMLMLIILASATVTMAETIYTEGSLKYTIEDDSITIIEYFGKSDTVVVPSSIANVPVNTIGINPATKKGAFSGTRAKVVKLPDSIMIIKSGAFDSNVEVEYNSNTDNPTVISDGTGPAPGEEPDNNKEITDYYSNLEKGEIITVGNKKLTVVEAGQSLEDEEGNLYTIDDQGNIRDKDDKIFAHSIGIDEREDSLEDTSDVNMIVLITVIGVLLLGVLIFCIVRKRKK